MWTVLLHPEFETEFTALPKEARIELAAKAKALQLKGPIEGRPLVDTLKGSKHANMKELRFDAAGGVWRAAFAFDPKRQAIVLVAGDKSGIGEARFYRHLIATADRRYAQHLATLNDSEDDHGQDAGRHPRHPAG